VEKARALAGVAEAAARAGDLDRARALATAAEQAARSVSSVRKQDQALARAWAADAAAFAGDGDLQMPTAIRFNLYANPEAIHQLS